MGASLRKIAQKSGATVGAIQTRYRSKDELFASLLKPFLDDIEAAFQNVRADYYSDIGGNILELLKASMQYESQTILALYSTITVRRCCFYIAVGAAVLSIISICWWKTR